MASNPHIQVEEVDRRTERRRFLELPYALHREEPRFAPPVLAYERWRFDRQRHPFFETDGADAVRFLVRREGRIVGRIGAHSVAGHEEGAFGFYDVADDPAAAAALVSAAEEWLRGRGCTSMTGPLSYTAADEAGVLVDGFDVPGVTGRPWHPRWYAAHLEAAGLSAVPGSEVRTWRLPTADDTFVEMAPGDKPPHAASYADQRIAFESIAAVPDVAAAIRAAGPRSAWALAKRARAREWEGCTVVRIEGEAERLVPALAAAAGAAGYRWVVAPWSADLDAAPETVHRLYSLKHSA